jgi:heat-inducible transcriptional repressor
VEQITQADRLNAAAQSGNAMTRAAAALSAPLSEARRGQIEESFSGVSSSNEYLKRTSHVLALISSGLGVALASSAAGQVLEHIHFSRLATDREMTHVELETAARYLNENFRGWPIERIRAEVARRVDVEREAYRQLMTSVEELCRKGALACVIAAPSIFVEGMANLISAEADRERLRQMLLALEAKQQLIELLNAYVDGRRQEVRLAGDAGSGADWRTGPAGRRKPGNGRRNRTHAHPISGDDSGSELHCAFVRAPA